MEKTFLFIIGLFISLIDFSQNIDNFQKEYNDSLLVNSAYAEQVAYKSLKLNSNDSTQAIWYKQLGVSQYYQKKYSIAQKSYESSLHLYKKLGDSLGVAKNYSNIGICFNEQNIQDSSIAYYTKSLTYVPANKKSFKGVVYLNIGKLKLDLEMYEQAKLNLMLALHHYDKNNDKSLGMVYQNLGVCYSNSNQIDSAIYMNKRALYHFRKVDLVEGILNVELNLVNAYDKLNKQDSVLYYLNKAYNSISKINNDYYKALYFQRFGIYHYKKQNFNEAKSYYLKAFELAKVNEFRIMLADLNQNLALVEYDLGNFKNAFDFQSNYIGLKDSLFQVSLNEKIIKIEEAFNNKQKQNQIDLLEKEKLLSDAEMDQKSQKITQQKLWFTLVVLMVLIFSLIGVYFIKRRKDLLEKEKVQIENKKLAIENKLLQTQMNPHFVFNSLNSIQRYVSENDTFNAQVYLARFGKLMRAILTHSRKETITLEEEIDALNLYVELEQLRFGHKITYNTTCSIDNIEDIEIPPMIVQPFVENAILHGFQNLQRQAVLNVDYNVMPDRIVCTITDNGVGRKKANDVKKFKNKSHKSMGIEVTKDRLKSLGGGREGVLTYEDLKENGKPVGTKVTVIIYQENEI